MGRDMDFSDSISGDLLRFRCFRFDFLVIFGELLPATLFSFSKSRELIVLSSFAAGRSFRFLSSSASSPPAMTPRVCLDSRWCCPRSCSARARPKVLSDGVRIVEGILGVSFEPAEDLRRLRPRLRTRLIFLAVVVEPDVPSLSVLLEEDESSDELEVSKTSCKSPGCDSSSMTCCGVLWYM